MQAQASLLTKHNGPRVSPQPQAPLELKFDHLAEARQQGGRAIEHRCHGQRRSLPLSEHGDAGVSILGLAGFRDHGDETAFAGS